MYTITLIISEKCHTSLQSVHKRLCWWFIIFNVNYRTQCDVFCLLSMSKLSKSIICFWHHFVQQGTLPLLIKIWIYHKCFLNDFYTFYTLIAHTFQFKLIIVLCYLGNCHLNEKSPRYFGSSLVDIDFEYNSHL